jgi:hypothetical protein
VKNIGSRTTKFRSVILIASQDGQLWVLRRLLKAKKQRDVLFYIRVLSSVVGDGVRVLSLSQVKSSP